MQSIIIDDSSPEYFTYSGGWAINGNSNEYNITTHFSEVKGASALFTFTGTSVQVFGTIGPSDASTTAYALDALPLVEYTTPDLPADTIYRQPFYTSPQVAYGQHTLNITLLNTGAYWLDYLLFTQPPTSIASTTGAQGNGVSPPPSDTRVPPGAPTSVAQPSDVPNSSSSVLFSSSTSGLSPTPTSQPNRQQPSHTQLSPALIGLAILATLVVVALLVGSTYWWYRRRILRIDRFVVFPDSEHGFSRARKHSPQLRELELPSRGTSSRYSLISLHSILSEERVVELPAVPLRVPTRSRLAAILSPSAIVRPLSRRVSPDHEHYTLLPHTDGGVRLDGGPLRSGNYAHSVEELPPAYNGF